jgi:hypothetical protein
MQCFLSPNHAKAAFSLIIIVKNMLQTVFAMAALPSYLSGKKQIFCNFFPKVKFE